MHEKKVLVIDDELSIRMLLENFLKKTYTVITKSDGMEGLGWLEEGNVPGVVATEDGGSATILCITTPRVIHDIRV